jgi:hypothetical protein
MPPGSIRGPESQRNATPGLTRFALPAFPFLARSGHAVPPGHPGRPSEG